jgi:ribulose-phosphate 3-epimerase
MISTICPTVLASDPDDYKRQVEKIAHFAARIHLDLADGVFAPSKTLPIDQTWWPGGIRADLHVMYKRPFEHLALFKSLGPQMVIVHAEADGDFLPFAQDLHRHGIEVGVALQAATPVERIQPALDHIDHVLVFSGNLGHFGGQADLTLLTKVQKLRALKPRLEIGWDGGINNTNARALAMSGVDVLNVGGFIQHAENAHAAYTMLTRLII